MALKVRQIWKMRRRKRNYKLKRKPKQRKRQHPASWNPGAPPDMSAEAPATTTTTTTQKQMKSWSRVIIVHSQAETATTSLKGRKPGDGTTHFHLVMSGRRAMFVQTTPSSVYTHTHTQREQLLVFTFFFFGLCSVNGKCCQARWPLSSQEGHLFVLILIFVLF